MGNGETPHPPIWRLSGLVIFRSGDTVVVWVTPADIFRVWTRKRSARNNGPNTYDENSTHI